jgi:hypothetical protein
MKTVAKLILKFVSTALWSALLIAALTGFSAEQVASDSSLSESRENLTATVLADERAPIVGGEHETGQLTSPKIYDASSPIQCGLAR